MSTPGADDISYDSLIKARGFDVALIVIQAPNQPHHDVLYLFRCADPGVYIGLPKKPKCSMLNTRVRAMFPVSLEPFDERDRLS